MHTISRTQPQTLTLTCLQKCKIGPHILCGFGRGKPCRWSVRSGEADVREDSCPSLPTITLNRLHYKLFQFLRLGRNPEAWSGSKACRGCGDITFPMLAPTSSRDRVTHRTHLPEALPQVRLCSIKPSYNCSLYSGKWQDWGKVGKVPFLQDGRNGARMANGSHAAPPPHIFHII